MSGGVLSTGADWPAEQPIDLEVWSSPDAPTRSWGTPPGLSRTVGSRFLAAPRGTALAVVRPDGLVGLVRGAVAAISLTVRGPVAMTPLGRTLFSVVDNSLSAWDLGTPTMPEERQQALVTTEGGRQPAVALAAVGETQLAIGYAGGAVAVVDATTGRPLARRELGSTGRELVASPDGHYLAALTQNALHLLSTSDLSAVAVRELTGGYSAHFSVDGDLLTLRTDRNAFAFTTPHLHPALQEPLFEGLNLGWYGPVALGSDAIVMPDGQVTRVCAVCSTGDPSQLRLAAARLVNAERIGAR